MKAFEAKAKCDIPLKNRTIKEGEKITVSEGTITQCYLWDHDGIYAIDREYIGEITKILSQE